MTGTSEAMRVGPLKQGLLRGARSVFDTFPIRGRFRFARWLSSALLPRGKVALSYSLTAKPMVFDFNNNHEVSMYFDLFAPDLSKVITTVLRPGDNFIDCGANVGYFSCLAASIVGDTGKVFAIDANPYCISRIEESKKCGDYNNIVLMHYAIGDHDGTIDFNLADDPMYSSIVDLNKLKFTRTGSTLAVPLKTFDSAFSDLMQKGKVRLLKIDIEGAELDALRGGGSLFGRGLADYVYIEVHHQQLLVRGQDPTEVEKVLIAYGYSMKRRFNDYALLFEHNSTRG